MSCTDCALSSRCSNSLILGRGSKARNTEVMIIQEAPSRSEDKFRTALTGDVKHKLNYFFEKSGIDYSKVYFTSAVKCNPFKTSNIKKKHLEECSKYLFNEIIEHKPKLIITMGRWAWQAVSNKTSIREFRGHFDEFVLGYEVETNGRTIEREFKCKTLPTFGLIASIGKWEYNADIIRDFQKANKFLTTGIIDQTPIPKFNTILTKSGLNDFVEKYREVEYATTDFETTGFNFWEHKIINTGYCSEKDFADILYLEPYKKEHIAKWEKEEIDRAKQVNSFLKYNRNKTIKALKTVNGFEHLKLILHNGKFDAKFAMKNGIPYKNFWFDTLVADSLIDENLGHALNIAMERRNINYGAYDTSLWKYTNKDEKKKKSYQFIPPNLLEEYLAIDVAGDRRLWKTQEKELKREKMEKHFFTRKMPALRNILRSEYVGVKMDRPLIHEASKVIQKTQRGLNRKIKRVTNMDELNVNSPKQVINYMVDAGYPFERLQIKRTANGNYSTSKEEMVKFTKYKKWKKFPQLVLNQKKLSKIRGTYVDGKCIRKNSLIEIVRDVAKYPKGIPIQDVSIGDLAYCYDNNNELTIRPVIGTYKKGKNKLVRIHYRNYRNNKRGSLDVTKEHKIRNWSGGYTEAQHLKGGERLPFLERQNHKSNYSRLNYKTKGNRYGSNYEMVEHRFVFNQMKGGIKTKGNHIHHIDYNPLNNRPENLKEMTPQKHQSLHKAGLDSPVALNLNKFEVLRELFRTKGRPDNTQYNFMVIIGYINKFKINYKEIKLRFNRRGEFITSSAIRLCHERKKINIINFLNISEKHCNKLIIRYKIKLNERPQQQKKFTKRQLLKEIINTRGRISRSEIKFETLQRAMEIEGINYLKLGHRFIGNREYVNRAYLDTLLIGDKAPHRKLDVSVEKFNKICEAHDVPLTHNHFVTKIEYIDQIDEVYDLEVEEFHNFIANEICVHNSGGGGMLKYLDNNHRVHANFNIWTARTSRYSCSSPSLQVWPRPIKGLPNVRNFVVPSNRNWCLFEADYSQLEQIVVANLSKDKVLIKRIQRGMDLHCINASDIGTLLNTMPSWVTYDHMLITNDKQNKISNKDEKYAQDLLRRIELDGSNIDWHEKRTQAKGIGFGLNYGKTPMTFAEDFGVSIDEAEEMVDAYFNVYSGLKKWGDDQVRLALKQGFVTLLSGRKRRLNYAVDWINSEYAESVWSTQRLSEEIGRQAKNAPVQGGAHEIFEPACNRLQRRIRKEKLKARLLLSIHDGIVGECPIEERVIINKLIHEEMSTTVNKGQKDELTFNLDTDFYEWEWYGNKIKNIT